MRSKTAVNNPNDGGGGLRPALPTESVLPLDWAAVRRAVRCQRDQRDRDDIIEWKQEGQCLYVDDRCAWFIAEQKAERETE